MNSPARMMLWQVIFVCYFLAVTAVSEELHPCTNETSNDCCLCLQTSCDIDCPSSLFRLIASNNSYRCNFSDTGMETTTVLQSKTTTTLTENITSDLNTTNLETTTESDVQPMHRSMPVIVCVTSCPDGYFHDEKNCTECNAACKTCNSSGSEGCLECKLTYNNTCIAECPAKTTETNSTCKDIEDKDDKDKKTILPIIIGASVGGVAVVVVVVVVIVVCCCMKRQDSGTQFRTGTKQRTVMSGILEGKKDGGDPKVKKSKGPAAPRRDYENTAAKDGTLKTTIPSQGDVVLRYTRDPTESVKANTMKREAPEPVNRDSTYANASTIKMVKNMGSGPTLSEELEIQALPEAPRAPPGTPDEGRGGRRTKSKVPLSKRISQKLNIKKKKKEKDKQPVDEPGENYIDMSHTTPVTERKTENQSEQHEEEDYENTEKKETKNQSKPGNSQTGVKSGKAQTGIDHGLEDYENAPEKIETLSKAVSDANPQDGGQEDYEVMTEGGQGDKGEMEESGANVDDQLEDYENIQPLAKAGKGKEPAVKGGKTKELRKMFETGKQPEKNVNDTENDLEDYENIKPLLKKGANNKSKTVVQSKKKVTENDPTADDGLEDYENAAALSKVRRPKQTVADTEKPYENIEMVNGKMK